MTLDDSQVVVQTILEESVLIDKQGIVALYDAVRKMMGFGLGALLYRAGKTGGRQGAQLLAQRLGLHGERLLDALVIAFNTSRWGQARLVRQTEPWHLHVRDSVLGANLQSKKTSATPLRAIGQASSKWYSTALWKCAKCNARPRARPNACSRFASSENPAACGLGLGTRPPVGV